MKKNSLKGWLAAGALAISSMAYAAPAESITLDWPKPLEQQKVENIYSIDLEWSCPVNVDTEATFTIGNKTTVFATGKFITAGEGASPYVSIQLDKLLSEPGAYNMIIPVGSVFDGETLETSMATNQHTVLNFLIEEEQGGGDEPVEYVYSLISSNPADGSTVESINHINTYWEGTDFETTVGEGMVSLYNEADEELARADINYDFDNPSLWTIDFPITVNEPGTYTVVIPAGILKTGAEKPGNPEVVLTYTIAGGAVVPGDGLSLSKAAPENGSTVSVLNMIDTYWSPAGVEGVAANFDVPSLITDEAGNEVAKGTLDIDWDDADKSKLRMAISPVIAAPGTYKVIIPAGAVTTDEGKQNNEVVLTYTVVESSLEYGFQPTEVTPEDGAEIDMNDGKGQSSLSAINITFPSFPVIKEGYEFTLVNEEGSEFAPETVATNPLYGDLISLFFGDLPSGKYTMNVPEGVIGDETWGASNYTSGKCNEAFSFSWTYIALEKAEIPEEIKNAPLELWYAVMILPGVEEPIDLLQENLAFAEIPAGTIFKLKTNKSEYANSLLLNIKDNTTGEYLWSVGTLQNSETSIGGKDAEGIFSFEKATDLVLYNNTSYTLIVEAYENYEVPDALRVYLQDAELSFKGLTEPYKYSEVEILDVTPEVNTVINSYEDNFFTVKYSAPVDVKYTDVLSQELTSGVYEKYVGFHPYEKVEHNADKTEWTFYIAKSQLDMCKGDIMCAVMANDMEGNRVFPAYYEYNQGEEENAYQLFNYLCYLGCRPVTVIPAEGAVPSLYAFEFTCPEAPSGAISFSGMGLEDVVNAILYDANDEVVTMMNREDREDLFDDPDNWDSPVVKILMHLNEEVTEDGEYTLYIEPNFFQTGTEFSAEPNCPQYIKYTVDSSLSGVAQISGGESITVVKAEGKIVVRGAEGVIDVYAVNGMKVASVNADASATAIALEKGIYVVVVNGKSFKINL